ncbi:kinase-like domain-containing protein [Nemania abortiva]|nr:kinase-like domain-containing protein [Nemania abortiva]
MGRFTFNSEADNVIFDNYSDRPFAFTPLVGLRGERPVLVLPNDRALIDRGTWVLAIDGKPVIEFEVLRRMLCEINHKVASKRAAPTDGERAKRRKLLSPAEEYVYTSVVGRNRSGNPIFYVNDGETLFCSGFQLKRQKTIFENRNVLVWRGEYHGLHGKEECVVKTLKSGDRDPVEVAQVWEREYDILKAVQYHPNIVRLVGADFRLHSFYLEHIDAKALSNQMKSNTSFTGTREDARRIMRDIASALAQIHAKGFAHGDVKPGNILYGPEHGAVLIDLGTAFPIIDPARFGGTPWYMPPEFTRNYQLRGAPGDVFALAVTSGWLTGHLQFPEKTWESWHIADIHPDEPTEGHRQAMDAMSHWLKHVRIAQSNLRETDPLENVIFKALDADRKTRISAAMICEELDRINLMDD